MNQNHDVLHSIDLNLLVAFDALVRERSVTRAAAAAGVTQSAMSHTLRRLRVLFDDPLLVRTGGSMVLTPRAEGLVRPIRAGLVTLQRAVFDAPTFDPATAAHSFRMSTPDLVDVLLLPRLFTFFHEEAPNVDLTVVPLRDRDLSHDLASGDLDIAIVPVTDDSTDIVPSQSSPGLVRRSLLRDGFHCLCKRDHPAIIDGALTVDSFLAHDHVLISPRGRGGGVVDQVLATMGLTRRIALRVPGFYTAPAIVAETDLLLTAPTSLAHLVAPRFDLAVLEPPIPLPTHGVGMLWHERFTKEPAHAWLRGVLKQLTA